jgi:hypothetical protein
MRSREIDFKKEVREKNKDSFCKILCCPNAEHKGLV